MAVRVFIAEDHPIYRAGLVESIRSRPELELVGETSNGRDALDRIRELEPDVVLLDLKLPELHGISVLNELRGEALHTRIVVLSAYFDGVLIYEALEAGAVGFLSKRADANEVFAAIRTAVDGGTVLSPGLEQRLAQHINRHQADEQTKLSARETEILELTGEGLSTAAIGQQLGLSEATIKTYSRRACDKLGAASRPAAIVEAMRRGILR